MPYKLPDLMQLNVSSRILRGRPRILVVGRCVELEKPWALERFNGYAMAAVCPEAYHVNMIGFKLLGLIARLKPEEVAVLTTDGSMHCVQLHYMLEELEKTVGGFRRRHFVAVEGEVVEVPPEAVKASRYLAKVKKLLEKQRERHTGREHPQS